MSKLYSNQRGLVNVRNRVMPLQAMQPLQTVQNKEVSAEQIAQVSSVPAKELSKRVGGATVEAKPVLTDINQKIKKFISLKI